MKLRTHTAFLIAAALAGLSFRASADAVYVASDSTTDTIIRIGANGAQSTFIGSGLTSPVGVVFDEAGNLYVSDSTSVQKFPADGGAAVPLATSLNGPTGLAIKTGDSFLYAAISGDNSIKKIPLGGGSATTFAPLGAGANPQGIAFDVDGNLYVANKGTDTIALVNPSAGVSTYAGSAFVTDPVGVAVTAQGLVAVAHAKNGGEVIEIRKVGQGNTKVNSVADNLGTPTGLALDSIGNYYVGTTGGEIKKVSGNTPSVLATISGPAQLTTRAPQLKVIAAKLKDPEDTKFASLGNPIVGAGGDVAFGGKLLIGVNSVSGANDSCIWKTDAAGTRTMVVQEGSKAPDETGATTLSSPVFGGFSDPVVNANGKVAFRGTLLKNVNGAAVGTLIGLWAEGPSGLAKVVRQGDEAPGIVEPVGTPPAKFTAFQQFAFPDAGGLVFLATISGGGVTLASNAGLWADNGAGIELVARKGQKISVNGTDKTIKVIALIAKTPFSTGQTRSFATDGGLLFRATFTDGSSTLISKEFNSPTLNVATYKNQIVALTPTNPIDGSKLLNPNTGGVNADLDIAFRSSLAGTGVTTVNNQAVFRRKADGTLELVAQKSFVADGASDAKFAGFSDAAINDNGEVAFRATLKPAGTALITGKAIGLWLGAPGDLHLVARQGDAPPSVNGTVKFTAFSQFSAPADGGLAFLANIAGTGITTANNQGVWQRDTTGATDVVIRKGDSIAIDNTKPKVASIVAFKALPFCSAQGRTVSADGEVALLLKMSDGNQVIVRATLP